MRYLFSFLASIFLKKNLLLLLLVFISYQSAGEKAKTNANVSGYVFSEGASLPYVNISIKGTTIGSLTDENGAFQLVDLPVGNLTLLAQYIGYKPHEVRISSTWNETREITIEMIPDVLGLEEVVVTGDRNARKRNESTVIVNSIKADLATMANNPTFSEALNYSPGMRLETNCQNCGFAQVRMNGLEGPYSQILINSRPIFSGLAGVYGLELIPSNMIDRIEVVRGAGSAVYGSNAIAGTINLILRDPISNDYEVSLHSGMSGVGMSGTGGLAADNNVKVNASLVSEDFRTGMAVYGFQRNRGDFDANGDSFSELTRIDNTTIGGRFYQRIGIRGKLSADLFTINEDRRGGNRFEYPLHEADIAEAVTHRIHTGAVTYDHFVRDYDMLSVFISTQKVDRDSYYGANRSPEGYGQTGDLTMNTGVQYKALFGSASLTAGAEYTGGRLKDKKLGANGSNNTVVANQRLTTAGAFAQYDYKWNRFLLSVGGRIDHYLVDDLQGFFEKKSGLVASPRVNLLADIASNVQGRLSYSKGFRAPQIFDEDLHVESSGSRRVIHVNDPDLTAETSQSFTLSLDINRSIGTMSTRLLIESFYTSLNNPFANEYGTPDESGTVTYTRVNATEGARVMGINTELALAAGRKTSLTAGITIQSNHFEAAQEFEETRFFRTPNQYGFLTIDHAFAHNWQISSTAQYTGSMLIPYFGPALDDPETGILRESDPFLDLGLSIRRSFRTGNSRVQIFAGIKNILNAYQSDFDTGIDRDPGYMYGPALPRTIQMGITVGNR